MTTSIVFSLFFGFFYWIWRVHKKKSTGRLPVDTRVENAFSPQTLKEPEPVFERKEYFFTYSEMKFYRVLQPLVEKSGKILFSKVRLEDLVSVRDGAENHFGERNRIKSRHIDFVICNEKAKPLLAIELDDHYHNRWHVRKHDDVKNRICGEAGIPLLRVPVQNFYDPNYLAQIIRQKMA